MKIDNAPPRRSLVREGILFALALPLFLTSLLTVASAPTAALWIVAIVAAEWGYFAALGCLVVAILSLGGNYRGRWLTVALALAAGALFLSPTLRAWRMAASLPAR